ncbi:tripartite tricarboxylate transporter TctB family protein [Oscillibacter sp.]|uniref:tripartite tricarboxylate transporter TctB family protein n=1 Tax=Oscillibacter sp. TaxID=1945593 RepID=UPI0028B23850|nr:tripartite tricarboxylate transporter TctB family protein [Oscillibacter sp.]
MKQKIDSFSERFIRAYYVYKNVWLGVFLSVVSAYLFYISFNIKIMKEPVSNLDTARFFPQLVFGTLIPIGIIMILRGFKDAKQNRETIPTGQDLADAVQGFERGFVALVSITIFIALMEPIGFIPAAIIYMIASMFFMSAKEGWKPVAYVIAAILVAVGCYFIFRQFVYVHLPDGILKGVLN